MSEDWMRDRIILIERELGGHAERTRSLEQSDVLIRREIAEIGTRITDEMNRQHAHLRGEITRLADAMTLERTELRAKFESTMNALKDTMSEAFEQSMRATIAQSQERAKEQRRIEVEEQNRQFKEELDRGKRNMRWAILSFGVLIVGFEKVLEYAPRILEAVGNISP